MAESSAAAAMADPETNELVMVAARHLVPYPGLNPRRRIPQERVEQLAASIEKKGVLQNLVVHETHDSVRWIVVGETRWRAVSLLASRGVEILLPCSVGEFTEGEALELAMLENYQRGDLTVIEEARGFQRLIEEFGRTQEDLAAEFLGDRAKQSQISNRIRLLDLPAAILDFIEQDLLPWSYARDHLMPWTRQASPVAAQFFGTLAQHLETQRDFGGPVSRPWLTETIARIDEHLLPRPAAAAPAPAPAPSAPSASAPEEEPAEVPAPPTTPAESGEAPPAPPSPPASAPSKPTPAPPRAAAPATAPAAPEAAPISVLPPPDAQRGAIPEGAGLISAVLAATGQRPVVITITPIPSGQVAVTVAPKILKGGETPFAKMGTPEDLDAELIGAIDHHFSK